MRLFAAALARGFQFVHVNERLSQPDAAERCNDLGGQLAAIVSHEENDAAAYLVNSAWCDDG